MSRVFCISFPLNLKFYIGIILFTKNYMVCNIIYLPFFLFINDHWRYCTITRVKQLHLGGGDNWVLFQVFRHVQFHRNETGNITNIWFSSEVQYTLSTLKDSLLGALFPDYLRRTMLSLQCNVQYETRKPRHVLFACVACSS